MANRVLLTIWCFLMSAALLTAQYDRTQFFHRGRQALIEGKYAQAIEQFNRLTQLDSTLYDAYFFRGIAKYNLEDFLGAEVDFDKTISINPIYTPAYHYRAITLSRIGKYDLALKDLEEAVDLRPSYTGLYFSRGITYFLSQQFDKAVDDFNRFIRRKPRVSEAYLNRGASYLFQGDTLSALKDYDMAISLNMLEPEGYIRRSRIYMMQNKPDSARMDLNSAIRFDPENSYAYFNRALVRYEEYDIMGALEDLEKVLEIDPGNSLTLYNRALIRSQIGDYNNALDDYDRVISINPNNVLAYYNRAAVFIELSRYRDAMDDYSQAINLYPDFANAYMNRSYVKNQLGQFTSARSDYEIAQKKISEYQAVISNSDGVSAFADTTRKYNGLLALDADFAKKDFNNEMLQYRDVDIRLKPLYKFSLANNRNTWVALDAVYLDSKMDGFITGLPVPVRLSSEQEDVSAQLRSEYMYRVEQILKEESNSDEGMFVKALIESNSRQYNLALEYYSQAIEANPDQTYYYINRGALQSDIIDFISSMENSVQVLTMDDSGTTRARVREQAAARNYDYTPAIHDMIRAAELSPEMPYIYYNLGNLYCLSDDLPEAILQYSRAIELYAKMGEAYYNRGLIQIFLQDKEKGCMDMSKAGELGITDSYSVIKKYCAEDQPEL